MEDKKKNLFGYVIVAGAGIFFLLLALLYGMQRIRQRDIYNSGLGREESSIPQTEINESNVETGKQKRFYSKLKGKEPVNIWIIGDRTGYETGQGSNNWTSLTAGKIEELYGSEVRLENLSVPFPCDALSHYAYLQERMGQGEDADLVILCMGYYENPLVFPIYYEALLRSLKIRLPETELVSLIESAAVTESYGSADETAGVIRELTEHYGGISVSMAEGFVLSGADYSSLTGDGHPLELSEEGNRLYADMLLECIGEEPDNGDAAENTAVPELISPAAAALDSYSYIPVERLKRISETDWQISEASLQSLGASPSGVVALDLVMTPGFGDVNVSIDGQLLGGACENETGEADAFREIRIINNNANVNEFLSISYETREQADGLRGLIFFGNLGFLRGETDYKQLNIPENHEAEMISEELPIVIASPSEVRE